MALYLKGQSNEISDLNFLLSRKSSRTPDKREYFDFCAFFVCVSLADILRNKKIMIRYFLQKKNMNHIFFKKINSKPYCM